MDIRRRLQGISPDEIIEVSYLVGRYLTHRIDDKAFENMFLADAPSSAGAAPYSIALDIVRSIETQEDRPIRELSRKTRDRYMVELTDVATEFAARKPNLKLVEDIQTELEQLRF